MEGKALLFLTVDSAIEIFFLNPCSQIYIIFLDWHAIVPVIISLSSKKS